jgi:anti-sigma B factor antagonist
MEAELETTRTCIVRASGEIDLHNIETFADELASKVEESPCGLIIDLSGTTYIDSAGIQILFNTYKRLQKSNGRMVLVVSNPIVLELLSLLHLEQLPGVLIVASIEAAAPALKPIPQGGY